MIEIINLLPTNVSEKGITLPGLSVVSLAATVPHRLQLCTAFGSSASNQSWAIPYTGCSSCYSLDLCVATYCLYLSSPSSSKIFSSKMFQFHSCISCENPILQYPTRVIIRKNGAVKGLFVEIMAGVETLNSFSAEIPKGFILVLK